MELIINADAKETAVNEMKTEHVSEGAPEGKRGPSAGTSLTLLDCGQATRVTKGVPYLVLYELGWPPFDRLLY